MANSEEEAKEKVEKCFGKHGYSVKSIFEYDNTTAVREKIFIAGGYKI